MSAILVTIIAGFCIIGQPWIALLMGLTFVVVVSPKTKE